MKTQRKEKPVAVVTIHGAGKMTKRGRRQIAAWLKKHAEMLVNEGDQYTEGRFTGRYMVRTELLH